eukprot:11870304-Prorocentrum_lima.AAC.1
MGVEHGWRRAVAQAPHRETPKQGESAAYHPGPIMPRGLFHVLGSGVRAQCRPQHGPAAAR